MMKDGECERDADREIWRESLRLKEEGGGVIGRGSSQWREGPRKV